jgi:hypothetical protein
MYRVKTGTVVVLSMITLRFLLSTSTSELLFRIPTLESAPIGNFTANEMEIEPSWEFQWRSFTEHVQNFWKILIPLCNSLKHILSFH